LAQTNGFELSFQASEHLGSRASLTERARAESCRRVGEDGHDVAAVAVEYGVGWHTIMRAVRDHGRPLVDDPGRLDGVRSVGVDETAFLAATGRHSTEFVTGIVDLTGPPRLLDVVARRGWPRTSCATSTAAAATCPTPAAGCTTL
jgi:transposase